jgi:phospholipid transport system transporter-binding protein
MWSYFKAENPDLGSTSNQEPETNNGGFAMPFEKEKTQGNTRLKIQGAFSIYEALALREELLVCLDCDTGLELDLGGVTECDIAGLQLLWAARKAAREKDKRFHVVDVPQKVLDTLRAAGLNPKDVI